MTVKGNEQHINALFGISLKSFSFLNRISMMDVFTNVIYVTEYAKAPMSYIHHTAKGIMVYQD